MNMIVLTAEEADQVRGISSPGAALEPRDLGDGRFVLPPEVLTDPAHDDKWETLRGFPIEDVTFPQPID